MFANINQKYVAMNGNKLIASSSTQSGGSVFALVASSLSSVTPTGAVKIYSVLTGRYLTVSSSILTATASESAASTFTISSAQLSGGYSLTTSTGYVSTPSSGTSPLLANAASHSSTMQSFLFLATSNSEIAIMAVVNTKLVEVLSNNELQADALTYGAIPTSALFRFVSA